LFIDQPMQYPRGSKFKYNNTAYVVLGLIIETITQQAFDAYLEQCIFKPCGMFNTGYYELDRLPANCAHAYIYDEVTKGHRTNIYSVDAKGSGAGGAFTTAKDVELFWLALMSGRLVSSIMLKEMTSAQVDSGIYGYGLWLLKGEIPSFQGCDPGVNFFTSYDINKKRMITLLANVEYDLEQLHQLIEERWI
jgi:CubicO group peptidase (beta-lactamase class C family)